MKINPVYKKELKLSVRSPKLSIIILIYNLILGVIGLLTFYSILQNARYSGSINYSSVIALYVVLVAIEGVLLVFIVPAITAGAISGERERQTLDILLTSRLTPGKIVLGKLSSSINMIILLIISSIPVLSLIFVFGGVTVGQVFLSAAYLIFVAFYFGSMGIFCSARFKKTTSATVITYALVLFFCLGTLFLTLMRVLMIALSPDSTDQMNSFFSLILLFNPGVTTGYLLFQQLGSASDFTVLFDQMNVPAFIGDYWFWWSIGLQLLLAVFFLFRASRRINPLRKKRSK